MNAEVENNTQAPATAGSLLRSYRQSRGVEPETLASALNVPVAKIQALEADRFEELLDHTFARALAMAICRYLKADATPVLAGMPLRDSSRVAARDERGIDSPLTRPSLMPGAGAPALASLIHPKWLALAVVVLGLLYLGSQRARTSVEPVPAVAPTEAPATEAAPAPTATGTASEAPGVAPGTAAPALPALPVPALPGAPGAATAPAAPASSQTQTVTTPVTPLAPTR